MLSIEQVHDFEHYGFVLVDQVFSPEELGVLLSHLDSDRVTSRTGDMPDAAGLSSKIALWAEIGGDVFGAVSAHPRMVGAARQLLREDVYHWHSKVMLKEPRVGGAWEWHQDYGYWYGDGCLYPRLVSGMLALDRATRENGCLKVLAGSHRLGRLDHGGVGKQAGVESERLRAVEERLQMVYAEAEPGSVLWFDCNLLHSSEANLSEFPRRSYICCYNALSNAPYGRGGHGKPEPIQVVPDDTILRFAQA